jgi:hypothetical protein
MAFGFAVGDFVLLTQLAWSTVQNARRACGEHDDFTQEAASLHAVLSRLQQEKSKPDSLLNRTTDDRQGEIGTLLHRCRDLLKRLERVLKKYNSMPSEKRSATRTWNRLRFGNGEVVDLKDMRQKLATHTNAIGLFLNLLSVDSQSHVERLMAGQAEDIRLLLHHVNWIVAASQARTHDEGSVLTSYAEDDKATWKEFRRELIHQGFSSRLLQKHKSAIQDYISHLGNSGALDGLRSSDAVAVPLPIDAVRTRQILST